MKRLLTCLWSMCLITLAGCADFDALVSPQKPAIPQPAVPISTACSEPRPTICTMEYRPVCARLRAGNDVTYASACNACADVMVIRYHAKACADEVNH